MSNEKKQKTLTPFMESFLASILGTTLSIGLTFGTTALINTHKKKTAQKQTAMLVIHDINNTIETLEYTKEQHEKSYEAVQYFLEHMDCPEAADQDRLSEAIDASCECSHTQSGTTASMSPQRRFLPAAWTY